MAKPMTLPTEIRKLLAHKESLQQQIKAVDVDLRAYVVEVAQHLGMTDESNGVVAEKAVVEEPPRPMAKPKPTRAPLQRAAVVEAVRRTGPRATVVAIRERLIHAGHDVEGLNLHAPLSTAVRLGELVRPEKGRYSVPDQEVPQPGG